MEIVKKVRQEQEAKNTTTTPVNRKDTTLRILPHNMRWLLKLAAMFLLFLAI